MTVDELIHILRKFDKDMKVLVEAYEDGYDDVDYEQIMYSLSGHISWYDGAYIEDNAGKPAIVLLRGDKVDE